MTSVRAQYFNLITNNLETEFSIAFYHLLHGAEVNDMLKKAVYNSYANRLMFRK